MYQQYLNEARAAQYQEQARREGAIERELRASRDARAEAARNPGAAAWQSLAAAWARRLSRRPAHVVPKAEPISDLP